jgi:hypothetical protein
VLRHRHRAPRHHGVDERPLRRLRHRSQLSSIYFFSDGPAGTPLRP